MHFKAHSRQPEKDVDCDWILVDGAILAYMCVCVCVSINIIICVNMYIYIYIDTSTERERDEDKESVHEKSTRADMHTAIPHCKIRVHE